MNNWRAKYHVEIELNCKSPLLMTHLLVKEGGTILMGSRLSNSKCFIYDLCENFMKRTPPNSLEILNFHSH
jgi:hypothetical protein